MRFRAFGGMPWLAVNCCVRYYDRLRSANHIGFVDDLEDVFLSRMSLVRILSAFLALLLVGSSAAFAQSPPSLPIFLRRAEFDPLRAAPRIVSALPNDTNSRLLLVQFERTPDASTRTALIAAGLRPLSYIPTNTFLVRALSDTAPRLDDIAGVRWYGLFQPSYKLPETLDRTLGTAAASQLELRLLVAPDADGALVADAIAAVGGHVESRSSTLNGPVLRVSLPAAAVQSLAQNDDILWMEAYQTPQALNDRAREIVGVAAAHQQAGWLTGAGQIVAVTDTGLDRQNNLSQDFAGRVAAAFTPWQMGSLVSSCFPNEQSMTWSDQNGHGTHVAGTILGNGVLSNGQFAGIAPSAQIVVQSVSSGGDQFDCFPDDMSFLSKVYAVGGRIQNASWGASAKGAYGTFEAEIDDYLWQHKDHLLVVAAGNDGADQFPKDGVIDGGSISSPAAGKNVLSVGASENDRPPTKPGCVSIQNGRPQQNQCWTASRWGAPFNTDFVSDDPAGLAAFSSRGPAQDGRIKPELVAPGTNIVSARSHTPSASYPYGIFDANYAYDSGTSMSTPVVSGLAALVRQWLSRTRAVSEPSSALVKALLMNGAVNITPGQYGTGTTREISASWPGNQQGWGRASIGDALDLGNAQSVWLTDQTAGLESSGQSTLFYVRVGGSVPLRVTLAWTDYPGAPVSSRALVNDLDLEVRGPDGALVRGNATAELASSCRDEAGADRCNNVESVMIAAPKAGFYQIRVRAAGIIYGPQPFALTARAGTIVDQAPRRLLFPYMSN